MAETREAIEAHLTAIYGEKTGRATAAELARLMASYRRRLPAPAITGVSQRDSILITYGDQVQAPGEPPLRTLTQFCNRHLAGLVSSVHVLPFYPFSSDDGFSVIDYREVDPRLGTWEDLAELGRRFRLMYDAVINHVSAQSAWFQGFLRGETRWRDYFLVVPEGTDLRQVVRPRTLPLVTRFVTARGEVGVWTTFSADQIDLNYQNPAVLLEIIDILLFYVSRGATFIRLDAIGYLWKEAGTTCIHLPQTHRVVRLLHAVFEAVAPHVMLITETNVPHADNIAYFGSGDDEAAMVYNFALPPLVLHTLASQSASALSRWAADLRAPSDRVTFFNFLASHDGIGVNPVRGILTEVQIEALVQRVQAHGGLVSYKTNPDGSASPYELNISYFDALSSPDGDESPDVQIDRFMAAEAIMLSLPGVPGIYFHSLFGSRSWREGVEETGQKRTINRQKCDLEALENELAEAGSRRARILARHGQLLQARSSQAAFDPQAGMEVLDLGEGVFAHRRFTRSGESVLCLQSVASHAEPLATGRPAAVLGSGRAVDVPTGQPIRLDEQLLLQPYQTLWLVAA